MPQSLLSPWEMAAAVVRLNETLSRGLPSAQLNKFLTERRRQDARDMKLLTSTPAGVPQGGSVQAANAEAQKGRGRKARGAAVAAEPAAEPAGVHPGLPTAESAADGCSADAEAAPNSTSGAVSPSDFQGTGTFTDMSRSSRVVLKRRAALGTNAPMAVGSRSAELVPHPPANAAPRRSGRQGAGPAEIRSARRFQAAGPAEKGAAPRRTKATRTQQQAAAESAMQARSSPQVARPPVAISVATC